MSPIMMFAMSASLVPGSGADRLPSARATVPATAGPVEPERQRFVNARQVFVWADGAVYHAPTVPGMITAIALQPGEALIAVAAGDTARWVVGETTSGSGATRQTHVLVKPFSAGLATNMIITTDRRVYLLRLTSGQGAPLTALSWTYPQDALLAWQRSEAAAQAAQPVAAGIGVESLNFAYTVTGDRPDWTPLRAFDDGRQTFIEFPGSIAVGEIPPLFIVGASGEAELVNYRMRGRFYVVDRLFELAELRLGTKKQQVVRIARGADRKGRK